MIRHLFTRFLNQYLFCDMDEEYPFWSKELREISSMVNGVSAVILKVKCRLLLTALSLSQEYHLTNVEVQLNHF